MTQSYMWKMIVSVLPYTVNIFFLRSKENHTEKKKKKVMGFYIISICQTAKEQGYPATIIV